MSIIKTSLIGIVITMLLATGLVACKSPENGRKVFSLYDISWEISEPDNEDSPACEPLPTKHDFDIDLHVCTYDGNKPGKGYPYVCHMIKIWDVRFAGDLGGGGPEWISVPPHEKVYFVADATPARKHIHELKERFGIDASIHNITGQWEIVYYEEGERKESESAITNISLDEPTVLAIQADIYMEPDSTSLIKWGRWVTYYIELPSQYDARNIDIGTCMLKYSVPAENNMKYDFVKEPDIKDLDNDGLPELAVKFGRYRLLYKMIIHPQVEMVIMGEVKDKSGV